jgi:hypothetical protein
MVLRLAATAPAALWPLRPAALELACALLAAAVAACWSPWTETWPAHLVTHHASFSQPAFSCSPLRQVTGSVQGFTLTILLLGCWAGRSSDPPTRKTGGSGWRISLFAKLFAARSSLMMLFARATGDVGESGQHACSRLVSCNTCHAAISRCSDVSRSLASICSGLILTRQPQQPTPARPPRPHSPSISRPAHSANKHPN